MYHPARSQLVTRNMPPLPPATMVIDMRGEGEGIISMLAAEIRHLTGEMQQQDITSWNSLHDIISFLALDPIENEESGDDELAQDEFPLSSLREHTAENDALFEPILAHASWLRSRFPSMHLNLSEEELPETSASAPPHPEFESLPHKIDLLRNARIKARTHAGWNGMLRYRLDEETVRVIFLADASNANSLLSTAHCAMYLKDYYRKYERESINGGIQSLIHTTVLCLNHEGTDRDTAPEDLIKGLRGENGWHHLDSLILVERYQRNMALMDAETQKLFAEQLLYILLTVSPSLSQPLPHQETRAEIQQLLESPDEQRIYLPTNTYLVGLSSIEHSTRWGYRFLNYGLAEKALQTLREENPGNIQNESVLVKRWINKLRNKVRGTLDEMLPAYIPDLRALSLSLKTASPANGVFSRRQPILQQGERSITELERYLNRMVATYTNETGGSPSSHDEPSRSPTLENAALCMPQIWNMLNKWDGEDPTMPLAEAQIAAYRVLAHPDLFHGPRGAIPVAKRQLLELANAIAQYEKERPQSSINVEAKQRELQELGQNEIDGLKRHVQRWPLLTGFLRLKMPLAFVINVLLLFLCFIVAVFSFAWLEQVVAALLPSVSQLLNQPLFGFAPITWFHIAFVLALLALMGTVISFLGAPLFEAQRSDFAIEIIFDLVLAAVAFFGLITWLSYGSLTQPAAQAIVSWYPTTLLLLISTIAFLLAIILMMVEELFYLSWWIKELKRRRAAIVETIRGKHQENIEEITTHIIDNLTFRLLQRAGLAGDAAETSPYYKRIEELDRLLINTLSHVEDEYRMADSRLSYEATEIGPYTREELLDVAALKNGCWRWREAIDNTLNEFRIFSLMLLQAMGEEKPGIIERQFREMVTSRHGEPYYVQTLTGMLAAVALRLSTAMPSADLLSSLIQRYEELDRRVIAHYNAPRFLIEAINNKTRSLNQARELDVSLAAQVLAVWGETIWEKNDPQLSSLLTPASVISRLIEEKRDPQTVIDELRMRASPSGRSLIGGLHGGLYLFVAPSPESREYLKNITLASYITDFPDPECLLMFYYQYFRARPLVK